MKPGGQTKRPPTRTTGEAGPELEGLLLDSPRFLVAEIDNENRLARANRALELVSAAGAGELNGQPLGRFVHSRDYVELIEQLNLARRGEPARELEVCWESLDGRPCWVEWTFRLLGAGDARLLAMGVEITRQKQAEQRAEEMTAAGLHTLLTEVIESTPDVVALLRADERLVYLNWAGREMFGVSTDNLTHYSLNNLRPTETVELIQREGLPAAIREGYWSGEAVLQAAGGEEVPVSLVIVAHLSPAAEVEYFSLSARDIREARQLQTELRKARDELEQLVSERTTELFESRQVLQLVLDHIPQRVFWKGRDLRYLGANLPFLQDSGVESLEDLIGKEDFDLSWKANAELYRSDDLQVMESGIPKINYEEPQVREDGSHLWLRTSKIPLRNPQGEVFGVMGTYEDITQIKRAREQLAEKNEELMRSNADLEQFAYIASHDLQEPLRMVASFAQLLERRYKGTLNERGEKYIGYIVEGAFRMQQLINDLLTYSRVGTRGRSFGEVDCVQAVGQALFNLQVAIREAGAHVDVGMLPTVVADETQINQVFQNLIGNAIKFRGADPPEVRVWAEREEGAWRFAVRDNGIGIDPQYKERIFAIFQRLHGRDQYPGTGIGLAVCKKIVQRHGGRIWFDSTPGKGSTFYFTIPDAKEPK